MGACQNNSYIFVKQDTFNLLLTLLTITNTITTKYITIHPNILLFTIFIATSIFYYYDYYYHYSRVPERRPIWTVSQAKVMPLSWTRPVLGLTVPGGS